MKKIVSILLVIIFLSTNFSFGFAEPCYGNCIKVGINTTICENKCPAPVVADSNAGGNEVCTEENCDNTTETIQNCATPCTNGELCNCTKNGCKCEKQKVAPIDPTKAESVMGITCDENLLVNGQCKLNIYDTLGIRKSVRSTGQSTSVGLFIQDIVLSATFFIGTLVTVALVVSGIMFIMAASSGKDPANAKKGIMGSLVGLLIVVSSYVIIRLVQYIAKGF